MPRISYARSVEDSRGFTLVVAASNSLDPTLAPAAYRCDGAGDEVEILAALAAVAAVGGCVMLLDGDFSTDAAIILDTSEQSLLGQGDGTRIVPTGNFNAIEVTGPAADTHITGLVVAHLAVVGTGAGAGNGVQCTYVDDSLLFDITGITFGGDGIYLDDCDKNDITNCSLRENTNGIQATGLGFNNSITGNIAEGNSSTGIYSLCYHTTIVSNSCLQNQEYGIRAQTATDQHVVGNDCNYNLIAGILLQGGYSVVTGNMVARNGQTTLGGNPGGYNILVQGGTFSAITGNECNHAIGGGTRNGVGIYVLESQDTVLCGNMCEENGLTGVGDGIYVRDSDYITIDGNSCHLNLQYGINIFNAACDNVLLGDNYLRANSTAPCQDLGTNTWLPTIVVPFVDGSDPADSGFQVHTDDTHYARAYHWLPLKVQQVLRIKVYARAVDLSAAAMRTEFIIYGAADNEAYTTHNGGVNNHPSTSTNFAADDVIFWTITEAGVLALLGGDSIEMRVQFAAAGNGDVETNAYFRTLAIEYV